MLNIEKYQGELVQKYEKNMNVLPSNLENSYEIAFVEAMKEVFNENTYRKESKFISVLSWFFSEHKILDNTEKRYLRGVIGPFRNEVKSIRKKIQTGEIYEFILIELSFDILVLPRFEKGTMYKGMVTNKEYTCEELGL